MKTTKQIWAIVIGMIIIAVYFSACQKNDDASNQSTSGDSQTSGKSQNSLVFPVVANMHGKSYTQWVEEWWKWNLQFDCAHFPLRDIDGSKQNQNQSGDVFFLSGRRGNTLSVTVPADVSLFFPLITFENDTCGTAVPGSGETVEHYLTAGTQFSVNAMDQLSLTIDGVSITGISSPTSLSLLCSRLLPMVILAVAMMTA